MSISTRYIKIGMVASIALFFSLVAFDNIIDFTSNFPALQHVLSMDTTFHISSLMKRAIINPSIQWGSYLVIVTWEILTATLCWIGCFRLLWYINSDSGVFHIVKSTALIGLFCGFLLYMVGFVVIGGEWFCMWQSKIWNAQNAAGLFVSFILFVMIFLQQ